MKGNKRQTTRTRTFSARAPKIGPRCMLCKQDCTDDQQWRNLVAPDGSYSVAVHDACLAAKKRTE